MAAYCYNWNCWPTSKRVFI